MQHPWDRRLGFWWIAEDHPDAPAIAASPEGSFTYGELAGRAHQLVHLFRARGLTAGDSVAVLADNGITLPEVSLACQQSGMRMLPLNTHSTAHEIATIVEHSGAGLLIAGERFAPLLGAVPPDLLLTTDILAAARAEHPTTVPSDRTPGGVFIYTSGTTGTPKGIKRPLPVGDVGEVANAATVFGRAFDFRPFEGPMLVSTGMFHTGSHSYYLGGLHVGHALVIMERFDPEHTLELIERHRVASGYMVPTQFHRLLQLPAEVRAKYDVSSLHSIVHSAAPCPEPLKRRLMEWWGPVVWETYGGSEGAATVAKPHRWLEKPGTVGRAVRGVQVSILGPDDQPLPPGEIGRVFIDNGVGFRYHGDEQQTAAVFSGSRFTLGDLGYLDDDGYLFISGRAKDMIITGGTNVYPAEIEAVLLEHPAVADVGVVGVPDDDWGESILAFVQTRDTVTAEELTGFCRARLASHKVPRRWVFRDDMPRTEAGKLYKLQLRDEYLAAVDR